MGALRALCAGLMVVALAPGRAAAEVDYPVRIPLPALDVAVGLTGAWAFDEGPSARNTGGLVGIDVGVLDGVLGVHLGVRTHREGRAWRLGGLAELTVWYGLLLGVGARFGTMLDDGGPGVPTDEVGLTLLVAVPWPVVRLDGGRAGALVVVPYARPGFRFRGDAGVSGLHELGVMLRWTSFGF